MPETTALPEVERRAPPLKVRFPFTVRGFVPFVREPELIVREVAVSWLESVNVPVTRSVEKDWVAASFTVFDAPLKVTEEEVLVNDVDDEVSQDPAIVRAAEPKVAVAAPLEVRFPLKVAVADVRVSVPDQVKLEAKVVVTPALTVRLFRVWGTFTVPADADTTTVDVPGVKVPAEVSTEVSVSTLPRAFRTPPEPTVSVVAVMARFEADVSRVVVELASFTCTVPAFNARVAIVNV